MKASTSWASSDSEVGGNFVNANEGGVLLTDEFGPTHDNVVEGNVITGNPFDCGITVPGHNPNALDASGNRQPDVAGVYDNLIQYNVVTDNGLQGEGAGVLFANATAGTASYDNVVAHNFLAGNELSGVTMHAHTLAPGQYEDLSGNNVYGNVIGTNNLGSTVAGPGDILDGPPAAGPRHHRGARVLGQRAGAGRDLAQRDLRQHQRDLARHQRERVGHDGPQLVLRRDQPRVHVQLGVFALGGRPLTRGRPPAPLGDVGTFADEGGRLASVSPRSNGGAWCMNLTARATGLVAGTESGAVVSL